MDKPNPTFLQNTLHKIGLSGTAKMLYDRRVEYLASTGAYEPTRPDKRPFQNFLQFITSPNSRASSLEHEKLVNFSRFLNMTGIGAAYNNTLTDLAIGSGLGFRASVDSEKLGLGKKETKRKNDEFTSFWNLFFNGTNGNYERMYPGGYFQALTFNSMLGGGDNFIIPTQVKPRKNHRFPFALKSYESELISTPIGKTGDQRFDKGIERNDQGIPVRIHIAKASTRVGQKDAAYFSADNWEPRNIFGSNTGIRQVFQPKNLTQDRPGALRGIPFLTPATGLIIDHNQFTEEILKTAKAQAVFAGIFSGGKGGKKMAHAPGDYKTDQTTSSFPRVDMSSGLIVDIPDGYELKPFESSQPRKEFTDFQMHILNIVSAITGISRSFILKQFEKSYSASKGETAVTWVTVLRHRLAYIYQFPFPFWEYLLSYGVSTGLVSAPGFFDDPEIRMAWLGSPVHQFKGPRMPQLDLQKEAAGLKTLVEAGLKSRRGIIEETSTDDPNEVFRELEEENEMKIAQGITETIVTEQEDNEE